MGSYWGGGGVHFLDPLGGLGSWFEKHVQSNFPVGSYQLSALSKSFCKGYMGESGGCVMVT